MHRIKRLLSRKESAEMDRSVFLTLAFSLLIHHHVRGECPHLEPTLEDWSDDDTWDDGKVILEYTLYATYLAFVGFEF